MQFRGTCGEASLAQVPVPAPGVVPGVVPGWVVPGFVPWVVPVPVLKAMMPASA